MSEHLFVADVDRVATPSRQSSLVVVSILIHAAVLVALLLVSILLPDVLPTPHVALAWSSPRMVRLVDIPLPPRRETARPLAPVADPTTPSVPLVAPTGVAPEPEHAPAQPELPGTIDGPAVADFIQAPAPPVAPPPPPAATGPIRLHSGIKTPVKLQGPAPVYPALARSAHAQGVVIIEATIDTSGRVVEAHVLRSVPLLDDAALEAVRQWQYTPATLNGEPVSVLMTVTVRFTLGQ